MLLRPIALSKDLKDSGIGGINFSLGKFKQPLFNEMKASISQ